MEIPVYLFDGFLEAGKTKLIRESMQDPKFNAGENTLILQCEEGVEEYETDTYPSKNIYVYQVENESDLTVDLFGKIKEKYSFERVIVEYNGMWLLDSFYKILPDDFLVYQEVFIADSATFENYNANMRQLVTDKLRSCEMVIFNRVNDSTDKEMLHRTVRAISTQANIVYEHTDGSIENDEIEDPLPFDYTADIVEIADKDYAIWYRDVVENRDRYEGKVVKFKGIIAKDPNPKNKTSVIGRHIMTCCANDIAYQGFVFKSPDEDKFKTRDWAIIVGKIKSEKHPLYNGDGPVIYAQSIEKANKPENEVATFY